MPLAVFFAWTIPSAGPLRRGPSEAPRLATSLSPSTRSTQSFQPSLATRPGWPLPFPPPTSVDRPGFRPSALRLSAVRRSGSPSERREPRTRDARGGAEATWRLAAAGGDPRAALSAGVRAAATQYIDDLPPGQVRLGRRDRAQGAAGQPRWARRFRRGNPMTCEIQRQCDHDGSQHGSTPHRTPTQCQEAETMCGKSGINWAAGRSLCGSASRLCVSRDN